MDSHFHQMMSFAVLLSTAFPSDLDHAIFVLLTLVGCILSIATAMSMCSPHLAPADVPSAFAWKYLPQVEYGLCVVLCVGSD